MPRYAAMLRGVMPTNCKMPALARCFEALGLADVRTVLVSGNVVFSSTKRSPRALEAAIERGTKQHLGRSFMTFVRSVDDLRAILKSDPFGSAPLPAGAKRVITFLREPPKRLALPVEEGGARIVSVRGREAFTAYVRKPGDPVFMRLIAKTLGDDVTTRTWETIEKLVR